MTSHSNLAQTIFNHNNWLYYPMQGAYKPVRLVMSYLKLKINLIKLTFDSCMEGLLTDRQGLVYQLQPTYHHHHQLQITKLDGST